MFLELFDLLPNDLYKKVKEKMNGERLTVGNSDEGEQIAQQNKPVVFISYNWESDSIADNIEKKLSGIACVRRDKVSLHSGDSISAFMKEIRKTDLVVVILSDRYLKSLNCMNEIMNLLMDEDWLSHSMFLVEDSAKSIYQTAGQIQYINYWEDENRKLEDELKDKNPAFVVPQAKDLRKVKKIQLLIADFMEKVKDTFNLDLEAAIENVIKRVEQNSKEDSPKKQIEANTDPQIVAKHILEIKTEIEKKLIDTSWVKTHEDRMKLLEDPSLRFKNRNRWILKNPVIDHPEINNGLIPVEPYSLSDNGVIVIALRGDIQKEIIVKGKGIIKANVFSEILFKNIIGIDEYGVENYPYPTLMCRFHGNNPFYCDVYYDYDTGYPINEDRIERIL